MHRFVEVHSHTLEKNCYFDESEILDILSKTCDNYTCTIIFLPSDLVR